MITVTEIFVITASRTISNKSVSSYNIRDVSKNAGNQITKALNP